MPNFARLSFDMEIKVVKEPIPKRELTAIAEHQFGNLVKAVVDIETGIMAIGGELHADEEALLLSQGSKQEHLWGINLYPGKPEESWLEFDSMINIRPSANNASRYVDNAEIRKKIQEMVARLVR